ncbi:MAG: HDOD domain-containing protein [candidate division Zixibacteria bacterium]|nr:HDOD domain-containing protein [candidate division Zixibacteria bacterium]
MSIEDKIIEKISSFPTLPTMASKLMGLINNAEVSASEIGRVVQYDPALTANLLKAANSAYLGQSCSVDSLSEAFFRLGTKWVYQMSVSSLIYSNLNKPVSGYELSGEDLWKHSVAVGQMSDILCQTLKIKDTGVVFTAGLLHDIGKMILGEFVSESFDDIQEIVINEKIPFEEAEKRVIGLDHAEVGGMTAEKWNFPQTIVDTIRWHHQPENAEMPSETIDIVHVADATCMIQGFGIGSDDIQYRLNNDSVDRLCISSKILEQATSELVTVLEDIDMMIASEKPAIEAAGRL